MRIALLGALACLLFAFIARQDAGATTGLDELAREYLFLELSMGQHDPNHVDAYFGPEDIRQAAVEAALPLAEIDARANDLAEHLQGLLERTDDEREAARIEGLLGRLRALTTRIAINEGEEIPFDEESRRLFGVAAPDYDAGHFAAILEKIDKLVPGEGPLAARVDAFRNKFVVPDERLEAVFAAAIAECRRRTLEHIELPENESFRLEYVTDKPWTGYNWYQGDAHSLIQINRSLPIYVSRAVDLGCHEGYPGHHTFNALLEENLVEDAGWIEFSLYPLFSPQSLIAEGSGNYGIELAFPGDERVEFEKRELFPLAGLDPAQAERYYALLDLLEELSYAGNEAARDYLNGRISREEAVAWLVDYTLTSPERARQRVDFFDTYRSYVINYNLGQDLVRQYVERGADSEDERWQRFEQLLSTPVQTSDLAM
ncbi:MAG TPA: hypothetical protein VFG91_09185 [Woeseiaceae bacterium]|nr:hypothetical protein [Woeseiaceae bacterium]